MVSFVSFIEGAEKNEQYILKLCDVSNSLLQFLEIISLAQLLFIVALHLVQMTIKGVQVVIFLLYSNVF